MKFTEEQLETIEDAFYNASVETLDTGMHVVGIKDLIAGLAETKWRPVGEQLYAYYPDKTQPQHCFRWDKLSYVTDDCKIRPLTTKEAGEEPMQHLAEALEAVVLNGNYSGAHILARDALENHRELMK